MSDELELMHIGILRKSGRYPWGSGKNPYQRNKTFLDYVDDLKAKGLSEVEIARGMAIFDKDGKYPSTTELRAAKAIAKNELRKAEATQAMRLKEKGYSNVAIGERMGKNESSIRALLEPAAKERRDILQTTAAMLKDHLKRGYLDIGAGTENYLGVSKTKLSTAVAMLKEEGYQVMYLKVKQLGTVNYTSIKVLTPPKVTFSEVYRNQDKIVTVQQRSDDGGRSFYGLRPPLNVDSKRIKINYAEDGGANKDGIIELRPGVKDLSMGNARYAQVRIAVDGTHYLKGMAVYSNDLPKGVDIRFNTNKTKAEAPNKLDALKKMKDDPDNPFGAAIKLGGQKGALNILNEEGDWYTWSKSLSSQMLSKQNPALIKQQLGLTYSTKKAEFDEIMSLTNPTIRKKLLESFADDAESSSVSLKAMGLPRTRQSVIIPLPSIKPTEVYAPEFRNGEKVVLIRHPHGGIFEIPELTVNNRSSEAKSLLGMAKDAVGIHPKVAEKLSGADFDGDTVLVIPNKNSSVKTAPTLKALQDFDPRTTYKGYDGMKVMTKTGTEMGRISNLITDMSIKGANVNEIARAVKHSMVVIDAEKHKLNYKQSEKDNGIAELRVKYQGSKTGGATTLISRAGKKQMVLERKGRPAALGGPIDKATGEKVYVNTGNTYKERIPRPDSMGGPIDKATGKKVYIETGVIKTKETKSTMMEETKNAFTLSSGTQREALYAEHANKLKAIANQARKEAVNTKSLVYSPTAKATYAPQVASLNAKLNIAIKNKPLERQAQLLANTVLAAKKASNPDMDKDAEKKAASQALNEARIRTGAKKEEVVIDKDEWEAIQAGAISNKRLSDILDNTDLDNVKKLATPRAATVMIPSKVARAKIMLSAGYTPSEIADALGVPTSTLNSALNR